MKLRLTNGISVQFDVRGYSIDRSVFEALKLKPNVVEKLAKNAVSKVPSEIVENEPLFLIGVYSDPMFEEPIKIKFEIALGNKNMLLIKSVSAAI